jgi:hypothetical protein
MTQTKSNPNIKNAKQNIIPYKVCSLFSPWTIILKNKPNKNPAKFPMANSNPTADPSPTGKTNSHPSYNIIGTSGIKKKELNADIKLAQNNEPVYSNG